MYHGAAQAERSGADDVAAADGTASQRRGARRLALRVVLAIAFACLPPQRGAAAERVQFETKDGFRIVADWTPGPDASAPLAILLHQFDADRSSWAPLVPSLLKGGFAVLALDQRGQGESTTRTSPPGAEPFDVRVLARSEGPAAVGPVARAGVRDVEAAVAFVRGRGRAVDRLVLVGASYGCTVALLASTQVPDVRGLALLSPGTQYFGVDVVPTAMRFRGRVALYAAEDDAPAARSARALATARGIPAEASVAPAGGHGVAMFAADPTLALRVARTALEAVRR